jgi:hypothetical protein
MNIMAQGGKGVSVASRLATLIPLTDVPKIALG